MAKFNQDPNNFTLKQQHVTINSIEEISNKVDANKMKGYQISKIIIALYYSKVLANSSLAMNTKFLERSTNEFRMLLCQNMFHTIEKFLLRYNQFDITTRTNKT